MREKLQRFMSGRYGMDAFSKFLTSITLVFYGFNIFIDSRILSFCIIFFIIYTYYRILSKNCSKRYQENRKFLQVKNRILTKFRSQKSQIQQRKTHHIYRCPVCHQKIRIPKGKGHICITCPKCKNEFTKIS